MFSGIIQAVGTVDRLSPVASGRRLVIDLAGLPERPGPGASVAVNGVCLTVVEADSAAAAFDVVSETLRRSNLGALRPGDAVNLELSLRPTDRIDGHFVLGHIDTVCTIARVADDPPGQRIAFEPAETEYLRYVVPKGSVALDGISLTVADLHGRSFEVAVIPETLRRTTLSGKRVGAVVNLETDLLVKSVVRQLSFPSADADRKLMARLRESGFVV